MKKQILITIVFFSILFTGFTSIISYAQQVEQEEAEIKTMPEGFLRAFGKNIIDEKRNVVFLRGVNLGGWLVPEGYLLKFEGKFDRPRTINELIVDLIGEDEAKKFWSGYRKNYITKTDIKEISALGFNHVRVPFHYNLFLSKDGQITGDEEGFKLLDNLIDWCGKYGLYVILDMHCAPGGQTGSNIDDSIRNQPRLWTDNSNKQKTIDIWRSIAKRYKDNTTVIGYDLLNEPLPAKFSEYNEELIPLYKKIISAIRKVDNNHIIFLEGANWANNFKMFPEPFDSNIVYSFHKYGDEIDKNIIRPYLKLAQKHNVPVWCGEMGENNNQWHYKITQLLEDYDIGWSFWPWKKVASTSGIYSISKPVGYDTIISYTKGGKKPYKAEAQMTLNAFLTNLNLENCIENSAVAQSLLKAIPATVEAENFGFLGEGVSYHDTNKKNEGKSYRRSEGVDIEAYAYNVGWIASGEWIIYDINNPQDRKFDIEFKVASAIDGSQLSLEIDDEDVTGSITVDNTGGWYDWQIITIKDVEISKGRHKVRLYAVVGGFNIDWFKFK